MKRNLFIIFFLPLLLLAQQVQGPFWSGDVLVHNGMPNGKSSAITDTNGNIYIAAPDTSFSKVLTTYISTNGGDTWVPYYWINNTVPYRVTKCKFVRNGEGQLYLFYLTTTNEIYSWKYPGFILTFFGNNYRDFDVAASNTTNGLYLFVDSLQNNYIYRYGSSDGGTSWLDRTGVTSNGAHPRVFMSEQDTLQLNFYYNLQADTLKSDIFSISYYQESPGDLNYLFGGMSVPFDDTVRGEFCSVAKSNIVWLFYTHGTQGHIDIRGKVSFNGGRNYDPPMVFAGDPLMDEYYIDANTWSGGMDLVYYVDSPQAGLSTNQTDYMMAIGATTSYPKSIYTYPDWKFSEHPPAWSPLGHQPTIINKLSNPSDFAVIWVGKDVDDKKLYFDRLYKATDIEENVVLPNDYVLNQNYPNPFNPNTKISYSIPQDGFVKLQVFNILGQEIETIENVYKKAGSYEIEFNGSNLSSGVYLYKLTVNDFSLSKKMILLK